MKEPRVGVDAKAAFGVALALAVIAVLIDNGGLGWMIGPVVLLLAWFAMARVPIRISMLVLMFFALTLENPSENPAAGQWKSPLFTLGALMLVHLKQVIGGWIFFSGMDMMLVALIVITFLRRFSNSKIDKIGSAPTPKPLLKLAHLSLAAVPFIWLVGKLRGGADGSMALWQMDRVMYLPMVFLLFHVGLRGPQDHVILGKVVLAAAVLRSCQAIYVQYLVDRLPNPETGMRSVLDYATTHHDSMLFAWAAVILASLIIHKAGKRAVWVTVAVLPVLVGGMIANERRMVWLQIILVFLTMYLATPPNAMKRKLQKVVLAAIPFAAAYVAAGWNAPDGGFFAPVQTIRSAVDSDVDASTLWRDIENFDLIFTFRQNPIFGTGYGHGFIEVVPLPPVDYPLERFIPHNSILGLWAYAGYVGYTALTLLWVAGVYFAMRAYHASRVPLDKAAAMASMGAVLIYYVQCYGDMGLGSWTGVFMMGASLAVAGKLAVATGAWPTTSKKRASAAAAARAPEPEPEQGTAASPS